ncbi:MAG: Acg family FMN-binding oxidoreductase [Nocardioidaceae bacterium]
MSFRTTSTKAGSKGTHAPPPYDEILVLACRAPSVHNTQPWLWRLHDDRLDLVADYSRQLLHADPDGRDLLLSCGAVLQHLQVAAAGLGWSARVRRLPDRDDPHLLATVTLTPAAISPAASSRLRAITARQTDRRRFTSWPVPDERLHGLAATGSQWGAQVLPVGGEVVRSRLRALTLRADQIQRADPAYVAELEAWVREGRDGLRPAGIPTTESAVEPDDRLGRRFPHGALADPVREAMDGADGMLIVCTSSDDVISRMRAGEAMSAVWLQATEELLSVVPLSQALEVPETRREVQDDILGDLAFPQIVLRVGWPPLARPSLPPTPRRDLNEVLVRAAG